MPPQQTPAEFRAQATALYLKVRRCLIGLIILATAIGFGIGACIGQAIRSHSADAQFPEGPGWLVAGLIGSAVGLVIGGLLATVIWFAATFFYAMTQDGA